MNVILIWLTNNVDWLQAIAVIVVIAGLPFIFFRWFSSLRKNLKSDFGGWRDLEL